MKLYVGFSRPKNHKFPVFSYAIRVFYWAMGYGFRPYSHVFVRWHSAGAKVDVLYEAGGSSVHFKCKKLVDQSVEIVKEYELDITREQYRKLLHYCMSNAGIDYGIKQALGIAIVGIARKLGKEIDNPFEDGHNSQVCSEVVGSILKDVADIDIKLDLEIAGPPDIDDYLAKHKEAKLVS